jgi:hypothetical protein
MVLYYGPTYTEVLLSAPGKQSENCDCQDALDDLGAGRSQPQYDTSCREQAHLQSDYEEWQLTEQQWADLISDLEMHREDDQ